MFPSITILCKLMSPTSLISPSSPREALPVLLTPHSPPLQLLCPLWLWLFLCLVLKNTQQSSKGRRWWSHRYTSVVRRTAKGSPGVEGAGISEAAPQHVSEDLSCLTRQAYRWPASSGFLEWKWDVSGGSTCSLQLGFPSCRASHSLAVSIDIIAAVLKLELPLDPLPSSSREVSQITG